MKKHSARFRSGPLRRAAGALALTVTAGGGAFALLPSAAHAAATTATPPKYILQTLNNQADPTFNQLLGINSHGVIAGYFGSGAAGHPNKGYLLNPPYGQGNYVNENFPGSAQTQVTGIDNKGNTSGFWVTAKGGTNHGFVEWNGVFESFNDPKTPHTAGSVNQLLGINDGGVAVGFYNDAAGHSHAYEVNQATGVFTAINVPGAVSALATGINDNGDVVGFSTDSASTTSSWLMHNGHLTTYQFPGGSMTEAFGVNLKDQIVGSYLDGSGTQHGFVLTAPFGPVSHWQKIDDPNGVGSTLVNGINNNGDLVGFYTDSAGNTDGMLATPAVTTTQHVALMPMPQGNGSLGHTSGGDLTVTLTMFGLTPGSPHAVELVASSGSVLTKFGPLTADGTGQASATLDSTYTGSIPSGARLVVLNGTASGYDAHKPIAEATLSGSSFTLTAVEFGPNNLNRGTPQGTATITYSPAAQTITVTVNASNLTSGLHAAHIHVGSCQSQGGVVYMLMDLFANSSGKIVNETRVINNVTTPIPPSGWYINLHQGNSNTILKNGQPTIEFRPLLCSNLS